MKKSSPKSTWFSAPSARSRCRTLVAVFGLVLFAACEQDASSNDSALITDSIEITVPSAGWQLIPHGVFQADDRLICIYKLKAPTDMAAQVISTVAGSVSFTAPDLPREQFVLGKTWAWNSNPEINFIDSLDELTEDLKNARPITFTLKKD